MKRLLLLLALAVTTIGSAMAKEVSPSAALRIAGEVLGDATRGTAMRVAWDSSRLGDTRADEGAPTFYVVTAESGAGFVIVAGDDAITPVLAYSTTFSAPADAALAPCFEGWLKYVDAAVRSARERGVKADAATAQLWNEEYQPVGAITLGTARWSQVPPYNDQCPLDGDAHSLTGCTQTAMAIIMNHYRWPERAKGVTAAYTTALKGIDVPARDLNHAYDWDSMLYTYVEGEYNAEQAAAVATIMADLGHAFQAEYTATDTGAMPNMMSLYENFGYSPASNIMTRRQHSDAYWKSLLRAEIEAGRPVFYAGYTAEGSGHAFVLDGVDDNDYFLVNWGWGGVYDGFFLIDNLMLDEYLFDTQHWAVMGMHPMRDGEVDNWLYLSSSGLRVTTTEFEKGVAFDVEPISMVNYAQLGFKGEVRVGVCGADGEHKSWVTEAYPFELPSLYAMSTDSMRAMVTEEIAVGDRLRAYYRSQSSDKWFKMEAMAEGACAEIIMKYAPIGDTTSISFDKSSGLLVVEYDDDVKSALYLLGAYVEDGVTIRKGAMIIDTAMLTPSGLYTIYLERKDVENKSITFVINKL